MYGDVCLIVLVCKCWRQWGWWRLISTETED